MYLAPMYVQTDTLLELITADSLSVFSGSVF